VALLRFNGNVSDLSLLTISGYYYYYYHNSHDKKDGRENGDQVGILVWVLVGVIDCVPRPQGLAWLHYFPCPCRLRIIRCIGH
jgi:hypothetical protein